MLCNIVAFLAFGCSATLATTTGLSNGSPNGHGPVHRSNANDQAVEARLTAEGTATVLAPETNPSGFMQEEGLRTVAVDAQAGASFLRRESSPGGHHKKKSVHGHKKVKKETQADEPNMIDEKAHASTSEPCTWDEWDEWGPCSTTCNQGVKKRVRRPLSDTCEENGKDEKGDCNKDFPCEKLRCIESVECPEGYLGKPDWPTHMCQKECTVHDCCTKACTSFACPRGFKNKTDTPSIVCEGDSCSENLCCDLANSAEIAEEAIEDDVNEAKEVAKKDIQYAKNSVGEAMGKMKGMFR